MQERLAESGSKAPTAARRRPLQLADPAMRHADVAIGRRIDSRLRPVRNVASAHVRWVASQDL